MAAETTPTAQKGLFPEYERLDFPAFERAIRTFWEEQHIFRQSIISRQEAGGQHYVFYEGPPSANGKPGIHHVMARTIKDIFCRWATLNGKVVQRKAGWDTHGLPVELQVEKKLGITKKDIGTTISIEEYNRQCRADVMQFKAEWEELTKLMGFWLDLERPYATFDKQYIESVWHLLKQLFDKGLLYKGYTIQPYSPAAGTGLSSHELNMPGAYKEVKDISATAMFKIPRELQSFPETSDRGGEEFFLAWTTTPWTLPANSALAVGKKIEYCLVQTFNPYTNKPCKVWLAKDRYASYFPSAAQLAAEAAVKTADLAIEESPSKVADIAKDIANLAVEAKKREAIERAFIERGVKPHPIIKTATGAELEGLAYEQLMPIVPPDVQDGDKAFVILAADFVTTEDGTGIVHLSKTFGADDYRATVANNVQGIHAPRVPNEPPKPIVDLQGKYIDEMGPYAGRYIKNYRDEEDFVSIDEDIVVDLKGQGLLFQSQKYEHNYPHCWRTDKPVLYYPLDSWFIRTTAVKERLIELNKRINWKPASTGTGRFGNWLENLQDWNLSRSRYWGTPLPIWRNADGSEQKCIGSIKELTQAVEAARKHGYANEGYGPETDLHRPYVDEIILADSQGQPMHREADLIDVWFDSGAMPYAQWHYPFENKETFAQNFPADFIAEGVDQTRGWFWTLHAIATMTQEGDDGQLGSIAFKNVVSNGLVLDKNGVKMSKRLGNAVDPFETLNHYGADPTRWYMISNAQPWENLRFDIEGVSEVQRKFFGTLYNTYGFFAMYANIDGYVPGEQPTALEDRPRMDRWVMSRLNSLVQEVSAFYEDYEPTRAARAIQAFVLDELSNWYVRLNRRRFWKGELNADKRAAFDTLHESLRVVAQLMSPIAPFFADWLYKNLSDSAARGEHASSVHLSHAPQVQAAAIDAQLEEQMRMAQEITSLVHSLRKKAKLRVRQPLAAVKVAVARPELQQQVEAVADLILSEVNVKALEYLAPDNDLLVKTIKPDFKKLGPLLGPKMKLAAKAIAELDKAAVSQLEQGQTVPLDLDGEAFELTLELVEVRTEDIPGWSVAGAGSVTVALDVSLTPELEQEGLAREFVARVQNLRKDLGFEVTDRISVQVDAPETLAAALSMHKSYICDEILATQFEIKPVNGVANAQAVEVFEHQAQVALSRAD